MLPDTLTALYERAVQGDRDGVAEIVESFSPQMLALAMMMGLPKTSAEDAVHGAWMKFFLHLDHARTDPDRMLRDPSALNAWLKQVTRNVVRDMYRSVRRQQELADRAGFEMMALDSFTYRDDTDERREAENRRKAMWAALLEIDEPCRELLSLRLVEPPMPYAQIAEVLGRPQGSVGPTIGRCIEKLRTIIKRSAHG